MLITQFNTFKYQLNDGTTLSNEATITVNVLNIEDIGPGMTVGPNDKKITLDSSYNSLPQRAFENDLNNVDANELPASSSDTSNVNAVTYGAGSVPDTSDDSVSVPRIDISDDSACDAPNDCCGMCGGSFDGDCGDVASCEDDGLVTCPDGSCAVSADDCSEEVVP